MAVYIRKKKCLTEDDVQPVPQDNQADSKKLQNTQEVDRFNQDIVKCQKAINTAEQRYQEEKKRQNNNINQLQQKITDLGGTAITPIGKNESSTIKFRLSKKLFEAVQRGKIEEFVDVTKAVFESLPDISYAMNDKECINFAKKIVRFLNEQNLNDNENHWNELKDYIEETLTNINISLSKREINQLIDAFDSELRVRSLFSWIFGNDKDKDEEILDNDILDNNLDDKNLSYFA